MLWLLFLTRNTAYLLEEAVDNLSIHYYVGKRNFCEKRALHPSHTQLHAPAPQIDADNAHLDHLTDSDYREWVPDEAVG